MKPHSSPGLRASAPRGRQNRFSNSREGRQGVAPEMAHRLEVRAGRRHQVGQAQRQEAVDGAIQPPLLGSPQRADRRDPFGGRQSVQEAGDLARHDGIARDPGAQLARSVGRGHGTPPGFRGYPVDPGKPSRRARRRLDFRLPRPICNDPTHGARGASIMAETAELRVGDRVIELPIVVGSEGERAIDISKLRAETGLITLDPGYVNTGSCRSAITFIDGDKGILRYRGISIEELAEKSTFLEVAYLLIYGRLPIREEFDELRRLDHAAHDDPRGLQALLRRAAQGRASDGRVLGGGRRPLHLLPGLARPARLAPDRDRRAPAAREDDHARGLRLQALDRPALHVSAQRSLLRGQLPAHDVRQPVRAVRGRSRRREGGRPAADPARGPRAELLDQHGPAGGLLQGEPLRGDLGGHQGALGPEPRGGQPGGDRDAGADRARKASRPRSSSSARRSDTARRG